MSKYKYLCIRMITCLSIIFVNSAAAASEEKPKEDLERKVAVCAGCHGKNGIATINLYPNLAGQNKLYLESQLKAFRSNDRASSIMSPMALTLNDEDIEFLADYYSSLK